MASVSSVEVAGGPPPEGAPGACERRGVRVAGLAEAVALTVALALGTILVLAPLTLLVIPATELPPPFAEQHQDAETLLFLLAFALVLPLAARFAPRLADRIAAGPNGAALPALAALLCGGLLAALLAVKVSERLPWGGGAEVLLTAMLVWNGAALVLLAHAASSRPSAPLGRIAAGSSTIWSLAGALLVVSAFALAFLASISVPALLLGIAGAVTTVLVYRRVAIPRVGRRLGVAFDVGVAGTVFLAVPNLVILRPEDPAASFETDILQFHQNFFLGPASHVLGGGAMLVDTLSQYGVGSIDFIAGWFTLVGVSNGTLGLLDGLLSGLVFVGAYFVIRASGVSRLLAASALVIAVVTLVLGLVFPVGGLLQHGAIRFGLPMGVLVAAVAELRFARLALAGRIAAVLVLGISSIWALEAFAYTAFTFAGVVAARALLMPREDRRRWLLRRLAEALLACLVAHSAFASATLVFSGELPDWGLYLNTLRAFLVGDVGDLTYDFSSWSPGLAVGVIYLASAAGVALLIRRSRGLGEREAVAVVAISGATAYGIALFSYLVNRSADHIVAYVSLPALMVVTLWLSLLLRNPSKASLGVRSSALGLSLGLGALLISVAWSSAGANLSESALAHVLPGGRSTGGAIERLRDFPPLSSGAARAEGLLGRYWPAQDSALVIAEPDLGVEALARTGRINVLPLSDPWEDSLVPEQRFGVLDEALDGLASGDRVLLDAGARASFKQYQGDPTLDPLAPDPDETIVPSGLAPLQEYSLYEISRTFELQVVDRSDSGLVVAELVERIDPLPRP